MLAGRGNVSLDAAFDRLRNCSRQHNLRLGDVSGLVVETDLAADVLAARAVRKAPPRPR